MHPDHRRRRLGAALLEHLTAWAAARGARVMRLSAEEWNEPALRLFAGLGFRTVGAWLGAERSVAVGGAEPREATAASGSRRRSASPRRPPPRPTSPCSPGRADRWNRRPTDSSPLDWSWRRLTLADLEAAARRRALWQAPSGWAVAESDEGHLPRVAWLCTYPEDARTMLRALVDLAAAGGGGAPRDGGPRGGLAARRPRAGRLASCTLSGSAPGRSDARSRRVAAADGQPPRHRLGRPSLGRSLRQAALPPPAFGHLPHSRGGGQSVGVA